MSGEVVLSGHPDGCVFCVHLAGVHPVRVECETHNAPAVRNEAKTGWVCTHSAGKLNLACRQCGVLMNSMGPECARCEAFNRARVNVLENHAGLLENLADIDPLPDDWPTELTDRVLRILDIAGSTGCLTWGQRKEYRSVAAALREGMSDR